MMSPSTIASMTAKAEAKARRLGIQPTIIKSIEEIDSDPPIMLKHIGRNVRGWELLNEHFVDHSGWGAEGEPAMTQEQFRRKLKEEFAEHEKAGGTYGYGITEVGQFQCYVGVFRKKD